LALFIRLGLLASTSMPRLPLKYKQNRALRASTAQQTRISKTAWELHCSIKRQRFQEELAKIKAARAASEAKHQEALRALNVTLNEKNQAEQALFAATAALIPAEEACAYAANALQYALINEQGLLRDMDELKHELEVVGQAYDSTQDYAIGLEQEVDEATEKIYDLQTQLHQPMPDGKESGTDAVGACTVSLQDAASRPLSDPSGLLFYSVDEEAYASRERNFMTRIENILPTFASLPTPERKFFEFLAQAAALHADCQDSFIKVEAI